MAENGRRKSVQALAVALASGMTVRDASLLVSIGERTAYRRLKDPKFRRRVSEARSRIFEEAVGKLAAGASQASAALVELLNDESPTIRLSAARQVLVLGSDLRAYIDFAERIEQLEKQSRRN